MPKGYNNLGTAYMMKKDIQRAAQAYQKAIRLDPENADSYYNLGRLYLEQDLVEQVRGHDGRVPASQRSPRRGGLDSNAVLDPIDW